MDSAKKTATLLKDADRLLQSIGNSPELSKRIMAAAQEAKEAEVIKLLKQTGITSNIQVMYNPDGIHIGLSQMNGKLILVLQWSQ
jgi:hypothetical protein